jgi:hypothetical protein
MVVNVNELIYYGYKPEIRLIIPARKKYNFPDSMSDKIMFNKISIDTPSEGNCKKKLYMTLKVRRMRAAVVLLYPNIHFNIIVSSSMAFTLIEKHQRTTK